MADGKRRRQGKAFGQCRQRRRDGSPYVSRSALREYLESTGKTEGTADKYTRSRGDAVAPLLDAGVLGAHADGWCVIGDVYIGLFYEN